MMSQLFRPAVLILAACSWLSLPGAAAAEDLTLYLNRLPHRLTETSGKQYDLFLAELLRGHPMEIRFQAGPLARSKTSFLGDPGSCLFPSNLRALHVGETAKRLKTSEPIDVVSLRLYTAGQAASDARLADFRPERVGYIRGSGAVHVLGEQSGRYVPIDSEQQLIRMVELGRIDAFLGHHPDTALALDQLEKPGALQVSPLNLMNLRFPVTFICHDNALGRSFLTSIDPVIAKMRQTGALQKMLGPHAEFELSEMPQDPGL